MVYCWKCGSELQSNVSYCGKCGSPVQPTYAATPSVTSNTGFEHLTTRTEVQDLWLRRVIAYIIDGVVIGIAALILGLAAIPSFAYPFFAFGPSVFSTGWAFWWGLFPLLVVAYFVVAEASWGRTIGKEAMGLRAVRADGRPLNLESSFVRNISKINPVLVLLDVIIGLVMQGDGRQKFTDRLAGTTVESTRGSAQILR